MRGKRITAAALVLAGLLGGQTAALAEPVSEVLFSHKAWQVSAVAFEDGTIACLAEVADPGESFSIWLYPDSSARIQFFSEQWDFGEGSTANLEVEVDRRSPWTLTAAELYLNSVLFNLPDSDAGVRFMVELAQGNTLFLRNEDGEDVQSYSLSGSRVSMDALIECGKALQGDPTPDNPFD